MYRTHIDENGWYSVISIPEHATGRGTTFQFYQDAIRLAEYLNKCRARRIFRKNHKPAWHYKRAISNIRIPLL